MLWPSNFECGFTLGHGGNPSHLFRRGEHATNCHDSFKEVVWFLTNMLRELN